MRRFRHVRGEAAVRGEFEAFVREHSTGLFRMALLLAGDRTRAEDLLQSALMRTSRRWPAARRAPVAYVRRVLVNLARDEHRRQQRRVDEVLAGEVPEGLGSGDAAEGLFERDAVFAALGRLPQRQREVVVMRFYLDLSVEQTAEALGCSIGTVKSYNARAISRLRAELDGAVVHVRSSEVRGDD